MTLAEINAKLKINPQNAALWAERGDIFHQAGDDELAVADETKAIALDKNLAWAYYIRAKAYAGLQQLNLSLKDFDSAVSVDQAAQKVIYWSYSESGSINFALKRYDRAIESFSKALAINIPTVEEKTLVYQRRAKAFVQQKKFENALGDLKKAAQLSPTKDISNQKAEVYVAMKNYPMALIWFDKAIAVREKQLAVQRQNLSVLQVLESLYRARAAVHEAQGNKDLAATDRSQARKFDQELLDGALFRQ